MTTQQINFNQLSADLGATSKRIQTIYSKLFGDFEATNEQAKPHVEAVLKRIKATGETVAEAVDGYKLEVQKANSTGSSVTTKNGNKPGQGSVSALLESDRKATRKLSQKRYAAIVQESNKLLADWLSNGLPEDELSDELENSIFDSDDMVLDALTEVIDSQGVYSYPKALNASPSNNSIAALLLPPAEKPTPSISNGNGKQ